MPSSTIIDSPQTVEALKRYIKRQLGEPTVDVELQDENLQDAIEESMLWWSGIVGYLKEAIVKINPNGGEFDVPEDVLEIAKVYFATQRDQILDVFDWAGVELAPIGYGSYFSTPSGAYSYIVQWQDYLEQGKKIVSVDPNWEYVRSTRKLRLFPGATGTGSLGTEALIKYQTNILDLAPLHRYEFQMVRRYALAHSMELLGGIRSKWTSIPSAQGETTLNGDQLLANAETMKADLEDRAKQYRQPLEFFNY